MFFSYRAHRRANALGFAAEKSCRANRIFKLALGRIRIIRRRPIFLEQRGRNHIDALVRALRREDRRHEELERISKIQLAMRSRINLRPNFNKLPHSFASCHSI